MPSTKNASNVKDYEVIVIENPDFLHLLLKGTLLGGNINRIVAEIEDAFVNSQYDKLFVDTRGLDIPTSAISLNFFNQAVNKARMNDFSKLACLGQRKYSKFKSSYESTAFTLKVNLKMFYEEDKAVSWLTKE